MHPPVESLHERELRRRERGPFALLFFLLWGGLHRAEDRQNIPCTFKSVDHGSCGNVLMLILLLAGRVSHKLLVGNLLERDTGSQRVINKVLESE